MQTRQCRKDRGISKYEASIERQKKWLCYCSHERGVVTASRRNRQQCLLLTGQQMDNRL